MHLNHKLLVKIFEFKDDLELTTEFLLNVTPKSTIPLFEGFLSKATVDLRSLGGFLL
jgi:hypothetical protein